jgi:type I restriction enzyme S subunit
MSFTITVTSHFFKEMWFPSVSILLKICNFTYAWEQCQLENVISKEIKGKAKAEMLGTESKYLETTYLNGGKVSYVDYPADVKSDDVIIL